MTPKQFVVGSNQFGLVAKPAGTRVRVVLASVGLAIVAFVAWRWAVGGVSSSQRALEITVLGVHDVPAPARPAAPAAAAPAVAPTPAVEPAPSAPATVEHTPP